MKTRNFVLTALALIVATTVSATKIPTLSVIPVDNQKALVAFETASPAAVELFLKNNAGEILYYKKSETPVDNMRMVFDFQELKDGIYDICLDFDNCKINREVTISKHHLESVGEQNRTFGPYCKFEDNLLKVSYLNTNQKHVLMNIYHEGQYVAGRKLGKEMCIQKVFDLSKLESGQYEIVLSSSNDEYLFTVSK